MNNIARYIKIELSTPKAEDIARYTLPNGFTDWAGRSAFEAGWYRAEAEWLARSAKRLADEIDDKDKEIERLTALLAR